MPELSSIPDETRWKIAAGFSAALPSLYDRAFRPAVGERYDGIEQQVWMAAAARIAGIAQGLALPTGTAPELAETMRIVMSILFGPDFKHEALELSEDGSVLIVRRCPLITEAYDAGNNGERTFHKCMAFVLTGIPQLNRDFSARYVRTMCAGDRQCEIRIARNPPQSPEKAGKKT